MADINNNENSDDIEMGSSVKATTKLCKWQEEKKKLNAKYNDDLKLLHQTFIEQSSNQQRRESDARSISDNVADLCLDVDGRNEKKELKRKINRLNRERKRYYSQYRKYSNAAHHDLVTIHDAQHEFNSAAGGSISSSAAIVVNEANVGERHRHERGGGTVKRLNFWDSRGRGSNSSNTRGGQLRHSNYRGRGRGRGYGSNRNREHCRHDSDKSNRRYVINQYFK